MKRTTATTDPIFGARVFQERIVVIHRNVRYRLCSRPCRDLFLECAERFVPAPQRVVRWEVKGAR